MVTLTSEISAGPRRADSEAVPRAETQGSTAILKNVSAFAVKISGRIPSVATLVDEEWNELPLITDLPRFVAELRQSAPRADLFTFAEPLGCCEPRFAGVRVEWDNAAAVPLTTFKEWWENRLPQESRKNVRRSERRGVTVRQVRFDDTLVEGIKRIYDETPIRQGRRFWHYQKDIETVRRENSSYSDRSDWFGAFFEDQLIGFLKVVYVGHVARIMQILSMNTHFDKRPSNVLLAKAVSASCDRGMRYFVYGKYIYGNKRSSPVTEFKRRNGFEEVRFPRYYIPMTFVGTVGLNLGLHVGFRILIPEPVTDLFLKARARILASTVTKKSGKGSGADIE